MVAEPYRRSKRMDMSDGCGHGADGDGVMVGRVAEVLRRSARKVTGPRSRILQILGRHAHPRTIREIRSELGEGVCDLATIYRSMHLLLELGLVQRFDFGDGAARFELVLGREGSHHHHVICRGCAVVEELAGCGLAEVDKRVSAQSGFRGVTHRLEFFGVCPNCQDSGWKE